MRLGAAVQHYLRARQGEIARGTRVQLRSILVGAANDIGPDMLVRSLKRKHVEAWLAGLNVQASTARHRLSALRTFCQWCIVNGYLKTDPTLGVKGPRQPESMPRELDDAGVEKLLAVVPDLRGEVIVLLGVVGGLRAAEIAGASRENLDLGGRIMLVHGKNNKERWIPVTDQMYETISAYFRQVPGISGPIVRSETHPHRGLTPGHIGMLAARWMRDAGVKHHAYDGRSLHALRHTMAGVMLDEGADIRLVQAALGHANLSATYKYLRRRIATNQLAEVMGKRQYGLRP